MLGGNYMSKYNSIHELLNRNFDYLDKNLNEVIKEFQNAILIAINEEISFEERCEKIFEIYNSKEDMLEKLKVMVEYIKRDNNLMDYDLLVDYLCSFFKIASNSMMAINQSSDGNSEELVIESNQNEPIEEVDVIDNNTKSEMFEKYKKDIDSFNEIADAIEIGYFKDGIEFSILEFWKRVPLKGNFNSLLDDESTDREFVINYNDSFVNRVNSFVLEFIPEKAKIIIKFLEDNKICYCTKVTEEELRYLCKGERTVIKEDKDNNGNVINKVEVSLTDKDLDNIIIYMKINKLPFLMQVFNLVQDKYIAGEIDIEELKSIAEPKYDYNLYRCDEDPFKIKVANLKVVADILNDSAKEEFQKAYEIYKIFPSSLVFDKRFRLVLENGQNDPLLNECYDLITYVSNSLHIFKKKGYEKDAKAIRKLEFQLEKYEQAKEVIFNYIGCDYVDDESFLAELGITLEEFNKHLNVIKNLAPNLYINYLEKEEKNNKIQYDNIANSIIDIAQAIQSGYFMDGTEFSMLEFWLRVPFKQNSNYVYNKCCKIDPSLPSCTLIFRSRVLTFAKHILSKELYSSMLRFFNNYGIRKINFLTELDLKIMINGMKRVVIYGKNDKGNRVVVADKNLNNEDLQNIIDYILIRKLPLIPEILNSVQFEYVQGKITKEEIESLRKNKHYFKIKKPHNEVDI